MKERMRGSGAYDPDTFYPEPQLMQRLDLLRHRVEFAGGVVAVLAPHGSGKTTMLERFLAQDTGHWRACSVQAETGQAAEHLLERLCVEHDVRRFDGDTETTAAALRDRLAALQGTGVIPLLVIDDAERLSDAALADLRRWSGCADDPPGALRILLFGEAALGGKLDRAGPIPPDRLHRLELPAYEVSHAAPFLEKRAFQHEQWPGFDDRTLRRIHRRAKGRPGAMLEQAQRAAAGGARLSPATIGVAAIGLVGVAVALAWRVGVWPEPQVPQPQSAPAAIAQTSPATPGTAADPVPPPAPQPSPAPPMSAGGASELRPAPPAQAEATPAPAPARPEPVVEQPAAEPPPLPAAPAPVVKADDAQATAATEPPAPLPAAAPATEPREAPAPQPRPAPVAKDPAPAPVAWWLAAPPERYTLQLLGVRQPESARAIAARLPADPPHEIIATRLRGGPWHVLVWGDFATRAEADEARARLKRLLPEVDPWVRSFADVRTAYPANP